MKNDSGKDLKYIEMAISLAIDNVESGGGPFGAVVVRNGKILSTGVNQVIRNADPTAHAEIIAIRSAAKKTGTHVLEGCTIYSSSEPCPMCLGAIYWANIERLVFASGKAEAEKAGFIDAHIYREIDQEVHKRKLLTQKIDTPEAGKEFKAWKDREDKNPY